MGILNNNLFPLGNLVFLDENLKKLLSSSFFKIYFDRVANSNHFYFPMFFCFLFMHHQNYDEGSFFFYFSDNAFCFVYLIEAFASLSMSLFVRQRRILSVISISNIFLLNYSRCMIVFLNISSIGSFSL